MKVEFHNFTVTEGLDGELTVTAKNGFALRLVPAEVLTGIHVHGERPGQRVKVIICDKTGMTVRYSGTFSCFPDREKERK